MTENIISLKQIVRNLNNANIDEEIVTFEALFPSGTENRLPVRIDAMVLALVTQGTARIGIDLKEYEVKENSLIVIQSKNYLTVSKASTECKALILAVSSRVVEDILPKLTDILPMLMYHRTSPVVNLPQKTADEFKSFYKFLTNRLEQPSTQFLKRSVICILQASLYQLMDEHQRHFGSGTTFKSRREELAARFLLSVSENFRENRQVSRYAEELCVTPKHLSTVVKEVTGRTAGNWIENYVIMEAKVLLRTTDMTIQEIADNLNFVNQSFFGKYFKHLTGVSPTQFRKENEEIGMRNEE